MIQEFNQGFITAALGSPKWVEFAIDLALSIKEFHTLPISIVTDRNGALRLKRYNCVFFDNIFIVGNEDAFSEEQYQILSKLYSMKLSPYLYSIFLDADMLAINSIESFFPGGKDLRISLYGTFVRRDTAKDRKHHGHMIIDLIERYRLKRYLWSMAGIIYFRKSSGNELYQYCRDNVENFYNRMCFRNSKLFNDEILFGLIADQLQMCALDGPAPIIQLNECSQIAPDERLKPLAHCGPYPFITFKWLMLQAWRRRRRYGINTMPLFYWWDEYYERLANSGRSDFAFRIIRKLNLLLSHFIKEFKKLKKRY